MRFGIICIIVKQNRARPVIEKLLNLAAGEKPRWILLFFLILTLTSVFFLTRLRLDDEMIMSPPARDPLMVQEQNRLQYFIDEDFYLLSFPSDSAENLYGADSLAALIRLTDALQKTGFFRQIWAPNLISDMRVHAGELIFEPLVSENRELNTDLRNKIETTPLFRKFFLSSREENRFSIYLVPDRQLPYTEIIPVLQTICSEFETDFFGAPVVIYQGFTQSRYELFRLLSLSLLLVAAFYFLMTRNPGDALALWICSLLPMLWIMACFPLLKIDFKIVHLLLPIIIAALSTSFGIHYYEAVLRHQNRSEALHSISPVLGAAGGTTLLGFASMLFAAFTELRLLGVFLILGIIFALLTTFFLLPVLLNMTNNRRIHSGKTFPARKKVRPFYTLTVLIVALLAVPGLFKIESDYRYSSYFRRSGDFHKRLTAFTEQNGGIDELVLFIDTGEDYGLIDIQTWNELRNIQAGIEQHPAVSNVISAVDFTDWANGRLAGMSDPLPPESEAELGETLELMAGSGDSIGLDMLIDLNYRRVQLKIRFNNTLPEASPIETLISLRNTIQAQMGQHLPGVTYSITGHPLFLYRATDYMYRSLFTSLAFFYPIVFFIYFYMFRSIFWSVLTLLPSLLTILVFCGTCGWLGIPLDNPTICVIAVIMGVGNDDIVCYVLFYRRNLTDTTGFLEKIRKTDLEAGKAIVQTTLAISAALAVLILSGFRTLTNAGLLGVLSFIFCTCVTCFAIPPIIQYREQKHVRI